MHNIYILQQPCYGDIGKRRKKKLPEMIIILRLNNEAKKNNEKKAKKKTRPEGHRLVMIRDILSNVPASWLTSVQIKNPFGLQFLIVVPSIGSENPLNPLEFKGTDISRMMTLEMFRDS